MYKEDQLDSSKKYNRKSNRKNFNNTYQGKCDVRLNNNELEMLDHLSSLNNVTRSDIMRRALRDYYKFNTDKET